MGITLDTAKAWKTFSRGEIKVVLTWMNDQRALILIRPGVDQKSVSWYVVPEPNAHLWGVDHPSPLVREPARRHAFSAAFTVCEALKLSPNAQNRARVVGIVADCIDDLVRMPSAPEPELAKAAYGSMVLKADGKPIAGDDMRDEVGGVEYG